MLGTDDSLAIMKLLRVPGVGPAKVNALLEWCKTSGRSMAEFCEQPDLLQSRLTSDQMASIESDTGGVDDDELMSENVQLISTLDAHYPASLRSGMKGKAPPLL